MKEHEMCSECEVTGKAEDKKFFSDHGKCVYAHSKTAPVCQRMWHKQTFALTPFEEAFINAFLEANK